MVTYCFGWEERRSPVSIISFPKIFNALFPVPCCNLFLFSTTVCSVFDVSVEEKQQLSFATVFQV